MSTAKARTAHAKAILGPKLFSQLAHTSVLLVGAGGIGCELCALSATNVAHGRLQVIVARIDLLIVKNIVLTGFGKITLLDLDTIDISNLNRQFLFKKKDVKQSKALARRPVSPINVILTNRLTACRWQPKPPAHSIPTCALSLSTTTSRNHNTISNGSNNLTLSLMRSII